MTGVWIALGVIAVSIPASIWVHYRMQSHNTEEDELWQQWVESQREETES